MSKRLLSLHRHAPGIQAREALDAVLVAGVFDQQVSLLFREEGVLQLTDIDEAMTEAVRSLSDYGIEEICVCRDSLDAANLTRDNLLVPVQILSPAEQTELISRQDMVLSD